jgi:hypothetical protein
MAELNRHVLRWVTALAVLTVAAPGSIGMAQAQRAGGPTIKEQEVAPPFKPGALLTLSPKGMRVASTRAKDNGKWIVQIDGVENPEHDEVLKTVPTPEVVFGLGGEIQTYSIGAQGPVAFSPDGKRYAYTARNGDDIVVIADGNAIFRAKRSASAPPVELLQFTPDGRHVYFFSSSGNTFNSRVLMMDGKPASPAVNEVRPLLFSADGSHWLLNSGKSDQPAEKVVVVDGKPAAYTCENARISPDGAHVACVTRTMTAGRAGYAVLVDGKATVTGPRIGLLKISPAGDVFATVLDAVNTPTLYRNGVAVPGSQGAGTVTFSPDGRHWAAGGISGGGVARWVIIDGKKQPDFKTVSDVVFSPDGTAWAYNAESDKGWHAIVNGQMREPNALARGGPMFAKTGHNFVYTAGPNTTKVYFNATASAPLHSVWGLELSPDGSRYAYYAGIDAQTTELVVDGQPKSRRGRYDAAQRIGFSPDSKHVFATAMHPQGFPTAYIDGTFLPRAFTTLSPYEFTPDSQHLISSSIGQEQGVQTAQYHLDGDVIAKCSSRPMTWINSPKMRRSVTGVLQWGVSSKPVDPEVKDWEFQPDGSIIFVCSSPGPGGYGPLKKITVTPVPGSSVTSWLGSLPK